MVIFDQPALLELGIVLYWSPAFAQRQCFLVGPDTDLARWLIGKIDLGKVNFGGIRRETMIRQIVIEAEPTDDAQSVFRLTINANLIAKGVTAEQAYYLVGEILRRIGPPERAETEMFDAEGDASESVRVPRAEAERREEAELGSS